MAWRQNLARPIIPIQPKGTFSVQNGSRSIRIWLDPALPNLTDLASLINQNGGIVSQDHADASTEVLILHPRSTAIFDQYCHPLWLSPTAGAARQRGERAGEEVWRKKAIVTSVWPGKCVLAGKVLRDEDDWGGCRKGG